jgi:hypothetical protein
MLFADDGPFVLQHNPLTCILGDRGKDIASCLTLVRAYLMADGPMKLTPLGHTKSGRAVWEPVVWLGGPTR